MEHLVTIVVNAGNKMVASNHDICLNDMYFLTQKKQMNVFYYVHLMFQKAVTEFLSKLLIVIL